MTTCSKRKPSGRTPGFPLWLRLALEQVGSQEQGNEDRVPVTSTVHVPPWSLARQRI